MGVHICTIAARNYLPFVRTLAESFREVHPDGTISALIFDDIDGEVGDDEAFEVLHLEDLGPDVVEFHRMAMVYDITEFATSLKPWLLEMLLGRGSPSVLYLDPDIRVYGSLQKLADLAVEHGIVLTPHLDTPMPLDGLKTDDRTILASGIYNLGFVGVGQSAQAFLDFWQERLRRECVIDPPNMRFVDQRWVDFVPGIFDHVIVRDPEYNVAYWNLHGRALRWTGRTYEVNGRPLAFFHFSGYSTRARHLLSKHQGDRPRILLSEHPDLVRLCDEYADLLVANGADSDGSLPYGFARMADGTPVDAIIRHLYRDWIERAEAPTGPRAALPPDPFDPAEVDAFLEFLNRVPAEDAGAGTLTAYLATVSSLRPDLHARFSDPQGVDHDRFMTWARTEVLEGRIPPALARDPEPPATPERSGTAGVRTTSSLGGTWAPADRLRPGIVVAGYLNAELGIGAGARLTVQAVEASGLPFTTATYRATQSRQDHPFASTGQGSRDFDTNIVIVNADMFEHFAAEAGSGFFDGRYTVAQWAWELEEFPPSYVPALRLVNEVWAVSEFARAAIAATTDKPVFAFPHPIVEPISRPNVDRASLGLPDGFLFLFCFDLFSVLERKNPLGLIDAFCRAFAPGEGPTLVLKAINGNRCLSDLERLRWAVRNRPDIVLIDRYLDHDENASLMSLADCYVSLHRSEGFGLTMAEAMALGKPVIATGYSGNLDFMDESTAYLVPYTMTTVPNGCDPYPVGAKWAEPDLDEAARLMRFVAEHPDAAEATGHRARRSVLEHHGVERQAAFVRRRFAEIQGYRARQIGGTGSTWRTPAGLRRRLGAARTALATARGTRPGAGASGGTAPPGVSEHEKQLAHPHLETTAEAGRNEAPGHTGIDDLRRRIDHLQQMEVEREAAIHRALTDEKRVRHQLRQAVLGLQRRLDGSGEIPVSFELVQASVAALRSVPDMGDPPPFSILDDAGRETIGYRNLEGEDAGYAGFEDIFRGPEALIRQRLRVYLPLLSDRSSVVDVGSGRGEMLDLLAEAGRPVEGIDLDASMVERASAKGHTVVHGDAVEVLQGRPSRSIGAVVCFQVVEHLSYDSLLSLLAEVRRVLEPGGIFIVETVNPHALQAFKAFWTDLTHRNPIFPEVLVAHCRQAGFDQARVLFPGGTGILAEDRWTCGDYAVIASVATGPEP